MRISRISVRNFRSLQSVEFEPGSFSLLVGRNNHGKTNLFEAMDWFYSPKGNLEEIRNVAGDGADVSVEIEFSGAQAGISNISNVENRQKLRNILGESDTLIVRRTSQDAKNRYIFNPKKVDWQRQPAGVDSAFNNCIPRFEFILTGKSLKEVAAYKSTTPIGQLLGGVISEALEQDAQYIEFRATFERLFQSPDSNVRKLLERTSESVRTHLAMQFPDCKALEFSVDIPPFEEFLKNYTTRLDDGVVTSAESKGDGMQRALMLAIIKAHADARRDEALGRAFIFFIDEAELHLHPTAQRQLKSVLLSLAQETDQVFLTTHSSVFLADNHYLQTPFVVEKEDGNTSITAMNSRSRARTVYELLGGSPTDLLFPANFLIVEGPSEAELLEGICSRLYPDRPRIHVVPANGDDERQAQYLAALMKAFAPLGDSPIYRNRVVILFDHPTGAEKAARLATFLREKPALERNNQVFILPTEGLEDYYPRTLREQFQNLRQKVKLARNISKAITLEVFERDMPVVHQALIACWEKAHQ
ncbi:AAA family ATPase [Cupriavidus basilensis]|uniref:Putative ATP-dependent endonuclease, OLD family n=1 Tax=Cupriavidus basilensis TaxID=68895 RepID=A0A0C4YJW4_9BURK|nr:AAA family ATPase [Cupriavidus basilensis]AJG22219.1 putative ATP-dependent endonuclease, OLD family [Cupriavidus basilensis]